MVHGEILGAIDQGASYRFNVVTWSQPLLMHYKDRSYTHDIRSDRSIKLNKNST